MKEVLAAGVFTLVTALVTSGLIEGGFRRRARRSIREEYELAETLKPVGWTETTELLELSRKRLQRYVTPWHARFTALSRWQKAWALGVAAALVTAGVAGALIAAGVYEGDTSDSVLQTLVYALVLGVYAGLGFAFLDRGLMPLVEALTRAISDVLRVAMVTQTTVFANAFTVGKQAGAIVGGIIANRRGRK